MNPIAYLPTGAGLLPVAVWSVIGANEVWATASLVALIADWWTPTTAGAAWTAVQAATVAGFAALQTRGLHQRED